MGYQWPPPYFRSRQFGRVESNEMPKATYKTSRGGDEEEELYYQDDEDMDLDYDDDDMRPGDFEGQGADQDIAYMVFKFKQSLKLKKKRGEIGQEDDIDYMAFKYRRNLIREQSQSTLSDKRQKGLAPSSEHPSHFGSKPTKRSVPPLKEDNLVTDPDYVPVDDEENFSAPTGRGQSARGRGVAPRGRGRPRGSGSTGRGAARGTRGTRGTRGSQSGRGSRGRGRGGNTSANISTASSLEATLKKWNKKELKALIWGANHLKPILKGKFKASSDGRTMKKLAWEELAEYVESIGKREWSAKQCKDKLQYFSQDAKKKRQTIDNKYKSGSGQREDKDYLNEYEEAILDWVGEDVVLGISGMQPPNLKGGGRTDQPWSCYDPERENREDYDNLAMPSDAMRAVIEGDLLATDEEGDPLMEEEDYNEPAEEEEEDILEQVDHHRVEDEASLRPEVVVDIPDRSLPDDDDINTPPPASVTRQKMLSLNRRENDKKRGIQSNRKPPEEELSPHARERVERKNELLKEVRNIVKRNTPNKSPKFKPRPMVKPTTSVNTQLPTKPPPKRVHQNVDHRSHPQPEVVEKTPEPASKRQRTRAASFSELLGEGDVSAVSGVERALSPVHMTSTPAVDKDGIDKDSGHNRKIGSVVDLTGETSDSKRRKLDYGHADESLPSLEETLNKRYDPTLVAELKKKAHSDMEETRNLIMDHNRKLCEGLMKHQDELAQNTQETASIMVKALKGISNGVTAALREHSQETARCLKEQRDAMIKTQEKYCEDQRKEAEDDCIALGNVHTKVTNAIVTKQVQLVKALEKLSDIMVENTEKVTESQVKMNAEVMSMQDSVASLSKSFSGLIINVDHLQHRCGTGMKTADTVDQILKDITSTVHTLNQAVTYSFDHNLIRAPAVRSVSTETEEPMLENPPRVSEEVPDQNEDVADEHHEGTDKPEEMTDKPDVGMDQPEEGADKTPEGTDDHQQVRDQPGPGTDNAEQYGSSHHNYAVAAFLTHPYPGGDGEVAHYHTTEQVLEDNGSISRMISPPLLIPGAAICQEATESNDGLGLPTFSVKSKDDFVIVQDCAVDQLQQEHNEEGKDEQPENGAEEKAEVGGDPNIEGDIELSKKTHNEGELGAQIQDDAKSASAVESTGEAGSVSDCEDMPKRVSKRLRIKKQLQDFHM